ncbi:coiled-coil domain-containing protein 15 isoform X3 [Equus przewalskii]|uniref:Coiled-coil domain-containing protein 15 isoform X3 n=1 Tax=Equus przewalskii TaxID=9798 RepID=A0ABM4PQI7_EQUPR
MPGSMAPLKKTGNTTRLPLALNPLKSKDVLAVLAERNQAIVPVGAWVEPASPHSSEIPASTSAYMIEEELKEELRKKQEALRRFQRQVKHRVNQQIRLRKKQQLQKSYEAAEKESSIAMQSSDPAHLTPKRTSVFPNNLNAAIGSARSLLSEMLGDGIEDRENQNELFLQQAQAKVHFKNPLFAVMEEKELERLALQGLQDILPETHDYLPEAQGDLLETQGDLTGIQSVELEAQSIEPDTQAIELEGQAIEPKAQAIQPKAQDVKTETQGIMLEAQSTEPEDERIALKIQDFQPLNQAFLPKDQNILPTYQDQAFRPKDQHVLSKDQNILSKCQDQDFPPEDPDFLPRDQKANLKEPASILIGGREREAFPLDVHQDLHRHEDQASSRGKKVHFKEPYSDTTNEKGREDFSLAGYQYLPPKLQDQACIRDQNMFLEQPSSFMREDGDELPQEYHQFVKHKIQDQASSREQIEWNTNKCLKQPSSFEKWEIERGISPGVPSSLYFRQQPSVGTAERWREDLLLDGPQHLPPKHQREASRRRQVYDEYQSGLNTEFQTPLALQSGVDQEEDKKERQKQYLRYRRLFMDIEREQVKEQQRQKEHRKKIEKIKKKKEQQRYAEEQRILRMSFHKEPDSGEKMSEILAQLQLEEITGAREKQQQREKEYQRYVEALRAQIQEKMQLYNVTLPPLCCCGPDFWDAHPDTCANNCIFYKNHRAYTRALHSVINSCDIPEGNSALRVAIHNFASAHRRTLKNL